MAYKTGDYVKKAVRSAAILTGTYVAGTTLEGTHEYNQCTLLVDFTKGSLTSLEVKVEFSPDDSAYYQETAQAVMEHTFTATGKYRIPIQVNDRYIKISAKGTGTVTSSSATIDVILGVN